MRSIATTIILAATLGLLTATVACGGGGGAVPTPVTPVGEGKELAPIEAVEIERVAAKPPNATLVVLSGLSNRYYAVGGHRNLVRDGDTISVGVTVLKSIGAPLVRAAISGSSAGYHWTAASRPVRTTT